MPAILTYWIREVNPSSADFCNNAHLTHDDRDTLGVLKDGVELVAIPSERRADELAAALHDEMPWMAPAS